MVSKVTRSRGADSSGIYRRPRLVLQAEAIRGPSGRPFQNQELSDAHSHGRRRLFADALRGRRRRHHGRHRRARQDLGIRRKLRARPSRRTRERPGARARRARSGAAADPGNGADFPRRARGHHPAAGIVCRGGGAIVLLRHGIEIDHAAGQANDRERTRARSDARPALELRPSGRGARDRAPRAAADPGENRLPSAVAQGIQGPILLASSRPPVHCGCTFRLSTIGLRSNAVRSKSRLP